MVWVRSSRLRDTRCGWRHRSCGSLRRRRSERRPGRRRHCRGSHGQCLCLRHCATAGARSLHRVVAGPGSRGDVRSDSRLDSGTRREHLPRVRRLRHLTSADRQSRTRVHRPTDTDSARRADLAHDDSGMSVHLDEDDRPYGSVDPGGWRRTGSDPRRLRASARLGDGSGGRRSMQLRGKRQSARSGECRCGGPPRCAAAAAGRPGWSHRRRSRTARSRSANRRCSHSSLRIVRRQRRTG